MPSLTSVFAPPITPPTAIVPAVSVIISMSGSSARSTPSSVVRCSPGWARRMMMRWPVTTGALPEQVIVERVQRLAELQHDVVGHVHDVADGPHPGAAQALLHPERRRADLQPLDQRGGVARAQVGRVDHDPDEVRVGHDRNRLPVEDRQCVAAHGLAGQRRGLAADAGDRLQVPERALDVEREDRIAQVVDQRRPHRRIIRQDQVALVLLAQVELLLRADHPFGHDAANLVRLQLDDPALLAVAVHQPRAGEGEGHLRSLAPAEVLVDVRIEVGRARDDPQRRLAAVLDPHQGQPVGLRVPLHVQDLADVDLVPIPQLADLVDGLDFHPRQRQPLGQRRRREGEVDEVFEPRERNFHGRTPYLWERIAYFVFRISYRKASLQNHVIHFAARPSIRDNGIRTTHYVRTAPGTANHSHRNTEYR